jgi:hypothetical protein
MVGTEGPHHRTKPFTLLGQRRMQPPLQFILDVPDLGRHPFACCPAPELEVLTVLGPPANMGEAKDVEGAGLTLAALADAQHVALPTYPQGRRLEGCFRGSIPSPHFPSPTLHPCPRGHRRTARADLVG